MLIKTFFCAVGERTWRDENQNPVEDAAQLTFSTELQHRYCCHDTEGTEVCSNPSLALSFLPTCNEGRNELNVVLPLDGAKYIFLF